MSVLNDQIKSYCIVYDLEKEYEMCIVVYLVFFVQI